MFNLQTTFNEDFAKNQDTVNFWKKGGDEEEEGGGGREMQKQHRGYHTKPRLISSMILRAGNHNSAHNRN